MVTGETHQVSN